MLRTLPRKTERSWPSSRAAWVSSLCLAAPGVRYDALKLHLIGSSSREVSVIAVRADAGVNKLEDLMTREVVVAGPSPGTDGVTFPNMLNNLLGTKFKIVTGYRSGKEMAMP